MLNVALTDSLSLKIPFNDCIIIDHRLTSPTFIYYEHLDLIDSERYPPKPIIIAKDGITIRIGLAEIPIYDAITKEKTLTQFINLTVSSKLLKHRYFDGITKETISILYDEFIAFQIFYCSIDTFLDGMASDIDVCINRYADSKEIFIDVLQVLENQCGIKSKFLRIIKEPGNIGLSFNTRDHAKPSIPFIKLYHKELELLSKSKEFYDTFLLGTHADFIKNLTRIEATIRNYDHKKRLEKYVILPKFKTLREYLDISQNQLWDFVVFSINGYIENSPRVTCPNLSPTDHIIYELLQNSISLGHDHKSILNIVENWKGSSPAATQVGKSRMRSKINELFDLLVFKDAKIITKSNHNKHVLAYLDFTGFKL